MNRETVSSTPVLRAALVWGSAIGGTAVVVAGIVGWLVAQWPGLWSGVLGALIGVIFPAMTAVSILIANRWFGNPAFLQIFFGIVMGGWLIKFILVVVLLLTLARLDWVVPLVFYFALVATAVVSLVVDLMVMSKIRIPAASDVELPQQDPEA
ncbi:hypothetical protein [uncultured Microbacterium sp.]|uniref:hypothetical protein n=1 Tax=uncultured Microbacterium sp. TaxID=191216 RepID=UPI00262CA04A|nr:hypothetical protein [uncultured Microbacterium sp.]